jgi:hypothetical protein
MSSRGQWYTHTLSPGTTWSVASPGLLASPSNRLGHSESGPIKWESTPLVTVGITKRASAAAGSRLTSWFYGADLPSTVIHHIIKSSQQPRDTLLLSSSLSPLWEKENEASLPKHTQPVVNRLKSVLFSHPRAYLPCCRWQVTLSVPWWRPVIILPCEISRQQGP